MFVSLIITIIPFYHGANRYLDATYVTGERSSYYYVLPFDFVMIFLEGLGIFVVAILAKDENVFYAALAVLFIFDAIWIRATSFMASSKKDQLPHYIECMVVNLFIALVLGIFIWYHVLFERPVLRSIVLVVIVILRTLNDYVIAWSFYYPNERAS